MTSVVAAFGWRVRVYKSTTRIPLPPLVPRTPLTRSLLFSTGEYTAQIRDLSAAPPPRVGRGLASPLRTHLRATLLCRLLSRRSPPERCHASRALERRAAYLRHPSATHQYRARKRAPYYVFFFFPTVFLDNNSYSGGPTTNYKVIQFFSFYTSNSRLVFLLYSKLFLSSKTTKITKIFFAND